MFNNVRQQTAIVFLIFLFVSCGKKPDNPCDAAIAANLPAVAIDSVYRDGDKIIITGNVLQVGQDDAGLSAHGIVWSLNGTPSLQNGTLKSLGATSATGRFTVPLDSLAPGDYQFRTYATNCTGTQYSSTVKNLMVTVQGKPFVQVNNSYLISVTGNDGIINPGDDVQYGFTVQNVGTLKASAVTAALYTASTQYIGNLSPASFNIGALNPGGAISGPQTLSFKMAANTPPGSYCLNLDIDADGEKRADTICFQVVQTVVADFTVDNDTCFAPCTVAFDASSSAGQNLTYAWNFGNGAFSSGKTTSYSFTKAGTFNVKLTIIGDGGISEKTIPITIKARTFFTDISIPDIWGGASGKGPIAIDISSGEYEYYIPVFYCLGLDVCNFLVAKFDNNGFKQQSPAIQNGGWVEAIQALPDGGFLFSTSGFSPFFGLEKTDIHGNSIFYKEVTPVGSYYWGVFADEKLSQDEYLGLSQNASYPNWLYTYDIDLQGNEINHYDSIEMKTQPIDDIFIGSAIFLKVNASNQYVFLVEGDNSNIDHYLFFDRRDNNLGFILSKNYKNTIWAISPTLIGNKLILFGSYFTDISTSKHNMRYFQVDLNGSPITTITDGIDIDPSGSVITCKTSDGNVCVATTVKNGNDTDVFIAKYNVTGNNFFWQRTLTSPLYKERAEAITEAPDGGFVITGSRENNVLFIKTDPDGKVE